MRAASRVAEVTAGAIIACACFSASVFLLSAQVPSDMARKRRLKTAEKFAGPHSDADGGRSKPAWKRKREEREAAGAGLPAPPPGGWKKKKKMKGKGGAAAAAPAGGDGGGAE